MTKSDTAKRSVHSSPPMRQGAAAWRHQARVAISVAPKAMAR